MSAPEQRSRGQALVEFALVAPFLFLLLFGVIEFGRFVYYTETLNSAAREGARYAIVHGSKSLGGGTGPTSGDPTGNSVKNVVRQFAIGVIDDGTALDIEVCWPGLDTQPETWDRSLTGNPCDTDNNPGSYVKVSVDYQYKTLIPVIPLPNVTLHTESILVINF